MNFDLNVLNDLLRRNERLQALYAAETPAGKHWVTMNGAHVLIDGEGKGSNPSGDAEISARDGKMPPVDARPTTKTKNNVTEGVIDPASLTFTEFDQGDLSHVAKQFGDDPDGYEYVDPVVAVDHDGDLRIIDGHHRVKYAKDANIPLVRYRSIPREVFQELKDKYDNIDIAAGVHAAAGDTESQSRIVSQFGGGGGYNNSDAVADIISSFK